MTLQKDGMETKCTVVLIGERISFVARALTPQYIQIRQGYFVLVRVTLNQGRGSAECVRNSLIIFN
jgi:hypothetical protein